MIFTSLQKLPKNGEDWGKLIVAKGFKRLPKVQKIAQSGHTVRVSLLPKRFYNINPVPKMFNTRSKFVSYGNANSKIDQI